MKLQEQTQGGVVVLIPNGPLISEELITLRRGIEESMVDRTRRVVVDMAGVPYLDSAGIEMLLEVGNISRSAYQRPKFAALSEACREALELTDVLAEIENFDTVENALKSCKR